MGKTIEQSRTVREFPSLPEIDDVTRREFLIGSAGLLLLPASCGSGGEGGEASGETRTVEHDYGSTRIPVAAQRVVMLDAYFMALPNGLLLDLPIVGSTVWQGDELLPEYLREDLADEAQGIESLGSGEVNVEQVAALQPDLIVCRSSLTPEGLYDSLSEIAPAVAMTFTENNPLESLAELAALFPNAKERADELASDLEARIEEVRGSVMEASGGTPPSAVVARPQAGNWRVHYRATISGWMPQRVGFELKDLTGIGPAESVESLEGELNVQEISPEFTPELDADFLFVTQPGGGSADEGAEFLERIQASPLWTDIPAVRDGRFALVAIEAWLNNSIPAAHQILDDIEKHPLEEENGT